MTEIQRYLAEEVAEDLADGIITRREAIRRLGLIGMTGAAATGLLATFAAGEAAAAESGDAGRSGQQAQPRRKRPGRPSPASRSRSRDPVVPLMAAWAAAAKPRGGVLVIHENRGLTEHIRTVAGRLAASGYSALALDLLSEEGGTGAFPGEAEVAAALAQIPPERFVADMKASVTELKRRVRGQEAGRDRVLLRRRHGVAPARRGRTAPRRGRSLLRTVPGGRQPRGLPRGGARGLRRTRRPRQRDPARGQGGARGGRAASTNSSRSPRPITPSSTTPAPASTRTPRRRPGVER